MKNYTRPIEKLNEDIKHFQSQLLEAELQHSSAVANERFLHADRINKNITYIKRRIFTSKAELSRLLALYDMPVERQLNARLIGANEFDFTISAESVIASEAWQSLQLNGEGSLC